MTAARLRKLILATLIATTGVLFLQPHLRSQPYSTFTSPDGQHRIEVFACHTWWRSMFFPSFPGQGGDSPGRIFFKDAAGRTLGSAPVDMVNIVPPPRWSPRHVEVYCLADWRW